VKGDDHGEAYTAILWGVGLSHERNNVAGAEAFVDVEGNMCGTVMRGPVALPGSEATSRKKGSRRNLGDLILPMAAQAVRGRDGRSRRRSRRGRDEESDDCIVPMKPRTKPTSTSVAETVEGRRSAEGKATSNACPGLRAGYGMSPKLRAYGSEVYGPPKPRISIAFDLRQEPGAGKPHAGICAGGPG
jgi:hypothetical protein